MPGYDKTGPEGKGPMTGRGQGYCAGVIKKGEVKEEGYGLGRGGKPWGCGNGRGFGGGRGQGQNRGQGSRGFGRGRGLRRFRNLETETEE